MMTFPATIFPPSCAARRGARRSSSQKAQPSAPGGWVGGWVGRWGGGGGGVQVIVSPRPAFCSRGVAGGVDPGAASWAPWGPAGPLNCEWQPVTPHPVLHHRVLTL